MDTSQWPQGTGVSPKAVEISRPAIEKKPRPEREQALNCPRCNSTNTKFCYYNNYSLSQPRYFCKTCRRYWTDGGSLRSVPVGGGTRRNKRSSSSSPSSVSSKKTPDPTPQFFSSQNPKIHDGHDLNLAYPLNSGHYHGISEFVALPFGDHMKTLNPVNPNSSSSAASSPHIPVMEFLKTGIASRGLASTFMPMPVLDSNSMYSSRFSLNEFKPTLKFTLDGLENSYENMQAVQDHSNSRLLFPFDDLKPVAPTELEPDRAQGESNGYWNGMLAGGSW